jgi:ferrous iron transport protein B
MSCSARLPVYALLLTFLFRGRPAWMGGVTLAGIYLGTIVLGAMAASIANRMLRVADQSFFMLELPIYRKPDFKTLLRSAVNRTSSYVRRAGPAIFLFALIIWLATTFPRFDIQEANERLNQSYAAQVGRQIEPVFKPMGADWRVGVGLLSAFAAREVFVSSMAIVFNVTDQDESSLQGSLIDAMAKATSADGRPLFTLASVLGLIIYFMIALQCLSTTSVAVRESGRWSFALMQLVVFNVIGYGAAIALVQGLRAVGVA